MQKTLKQHQYKFTRNAYFQTICMKCMVSQFSYLCPFVTFICYNCVPQQLLGISFHLHFRVSIFFVNQYFFDKIGFCNKQLCFWTMPIEKVSSCNKHQETGSKLEYSVGSTFDVLIFSLYSNSGQVSDTHNHY